MIHPGSKWIRVYDSPQLLEEHVTVTEVTEARDTIWVRYETDSRSNTGTYSGKVSGWHQAFRPLRES